MKNWDFEDFIIKNILSLLVEDRIEYIGNLYRFGIINQTEMGCLFTIANNSGFKAWVS